MNLHYLPLAKPDESPTSMIRRAAIHNGYPSCEVFVNHFLGKSYYNSLLFQEGKLARKLADLAFPYEQELLKGFYQVSLDAKDQNRIIRLHDITIPNALLRYAEAAICTDCQEEELERRIKDLRSSFYCPLHHKQYLTCCLSCGRHFCWYNQITMHCACGERLQSPTANSADVYPETLVASLLKTKNQERIDLFSQTLYAMDFYASRHKKDTTRNRNIVKAAIGLAYGEIDLCTESLATLSGGNSELGKAMLVAKLPSRPNLIDIEEIYEALCKKTQPGSQSSSETLTTEQVRKLINVSAAQWNKIQAHPQFPRTSRTRPRYHDSDVKIIIALNEETRIRIAKPHTYDHLISFRECFAKLKMPKSNFSNLCKQGFFGLPIQTGKNTQHYFAIEQFESFNHKYISVWQLAEKLNLPVRTIRNIIRECNLTAVNTDRYQTSPSPVPSFIKRSDIETLMLHNDDSEPDKNATIQTLLSTCPALPETMFSLVLSSHDAALRLGTHRLYIYALVHKGMLDAYDKGRQLYVTFDSFKKLKQEYMTGKELEKLLDIHSLRIPQILAYYGMLDLAIALPYKQLQYIYRRVDFSPERLRFLNPANSDYGRAHLNNKLVRVSAICKEIGITPHELHKITDNIFKARPEHYRTAAHRLHLSTSEANKIRQFIGRLLPISTLSITHCVPLTEIECRFIRKNAITSYQVRKEFLITKKNYRTLDKFYASNFTLNHSKKITGLPRGYLQNLLNRKIIYGCSIPLGGCQMPIMLSIETFRYAIGRYKRTGSKLLNLTLAQL